MGSMNKCGENLRDCDDDIEAVEHDSLKPMRLSISIKSISTFPKNAGASILTKSDN